MKLSEIRSQPIPARALIIKKVLLSGPVGCGKTSVALALAEHHAGIEYNLSSVDIRRINCAEITIDDVRRLILELRYKPFDQRARCKGYILDELHVLPDKCEKALLIPLEEDNYNFWAGCTNHPDRVSEPLQSRFSLHMALQAPSEETITAILIENGEAPATAAAIARNSNGDLRRALFGGDAFNYADELIKTSTAQALLHLARRNPLQVQAELLNKYLTNPEKHAILCGYLNTANFEVAAHQLVSLARRAGVVK